MSQQVGALAALPDLSSILRLKDLRFGSQHCVMQLTTTCDSSTR